MGEKKEEPKKEAKKEKKEVERPAGYISKEDKEIYANKVIEFLKKTPLNEEQQSKVLSTAYYKHREDSGLKKSRG